MKLNDERIYAAVVLQNGHIIAEYGHPDALYPQYSITKSIVSLCIGSLIDEGRLSLRSTVGEYLDTPKDAPLSGVTLERLLTMRSGIREKILFADRRGCPDYLAACLAQEIKEQPAQYNNADAYLAGRMAETAYGKPLEDLIISRFFEPLGIVSCDFEHDPQGGFFGASGLMLSTRDLAKLGESVRTGELSPREYLRQAVQAQTQIDGRGYGYFFWNDGECYSMSGKWGQKCYIFPQQNAIIAMNSDHGDVDTALRETILPLLRGNCHAV